MLDDFYNTIRNIENFDIEKEAIEIINDSSEYLIELLKDQLALGKDKDGAPVTVFDRPFYSQRTLNEKKYQDGLSGETRWITNYMSGAFYANMRLVTVGQNFSIVSDVPYFDSIIYQSGEEIMELDKQHLQQFSDEVFMPRLQEAFENAVNGL